MHGHNNTTLVVTELCSVNKHYFCNSRLPRMTSRLTQFMIASCGSLLEVLIIIRRWFSSCLPAQSWNCCGSRPNVHVIIIIVIRVIEIVIIIKTDVILETQNPIKISYILVSQTLFQCWMTWYNHQLVKSSILILKVFAHSPYLHHHHRRHLDQSPCPCLQRLVLPEGRHWLLHQLLWLLGHLLLQGIQQMLRFSQYTFIL